MYNQYFLKTIPYVLLDEDTLSQMATSRDAMTDKLNELFIVGKALAFSSIKNKYIKNIVNNLPCNWDQPECKIKRRKAQRFQDSGKVDHKGEYTIFGQIWSTLKKTNYNSLKKNDANTKAWSASLVGEGSIDGGGPYRETITNMCGELMHNVLPLLIPTPNNKNDHGLNRDCWTINPSAKSPTHLEMYEFLGALMGMAFRSGQILDLKLTSFFYKSLAGEPLTIEDLKAIDLYAVQAIKEIENTKKNVTEEMFDSYGAQTMTTRLSNQEEVDLIPKGKEITLKYKDIDEFVRLTLDARFKEAEKQMQAIRKGFEIVFPTTVMGILTWREVEYRIIGPTEIDMEELKKITNYSCCSETDEYVQRFWRAFEGFTQEERSMYLKFVWGRSRLPPPDSSGIQRHVIYLMYAGQYPDHNQVLPQAHT